MAAFGLLEEELGEWRLSRWQKERRRSWRWKQWCEEGRGPGCSTGIPCVRGFWPRGLWPSADAPGAAGEELGTFDLPAGFECLFDGGLIGLTGGFDGKPFRIEGLLVVDHHG